jgi:hypothetical protein
MVAWPSLTCIGSLLDDLGLYKPHELLHDQETGVALDSASILKKYQSQRLTISDVHGSPKQRIEENRCGNSVVDENAFSRSHVDNILFSGDFISSNWPMSL